MKTAQEAEAAVRARDAAVAESSKLPGASSDKQEFRTFSKVKLTYDNVDADRDAMLHYV